MASLFDICSSVGNSKVPRKGSSHRTCTIRKAMTDTEWIFFNLELENDQGGLYLLECATSVSQNSLYPFLSKPSQG